MLTIAGAAGAVGALSITARYFYKKMLKSNENKTENDEDDSYDPSVMETMDSLQGFSIYASPTLNECLQVERGSDLNAHNVDLSGERTRQEIVNNSRPWLPYMTSKPRSTLVSSSQKSIRMPLHDKEMVSC